MPRRRTIPPKAKAEKRKKVCSNAMKKMRGKVEAAREELASSSADSDSEFESGSDTSNANSDCQSSPEGPPRPRKAKKAKTKEANTAETSKNLKFPLENDHGVVHQQYHQDTGVPPSLEQRESHSEDADLDDSSFPSDDPDDISSEEEGGDQFLPDEPQPSDPDDSSGSSDSSENSSHSQGSDDNSSGEENQQDPLLYPPSHPIPYNQEDPVPGDRAMEFFRAVTSVKARHEVSDAAIYDLLKVYHSNTVFTPSTNHF